MNVYCVKCGVRLQEGVTRCPLCDTPVWDPVSTEPAPTFSDCYPDPLKSRRYPIMAFLTALMAAICLSSLIYCLTNYHAVSWSGFVMLGCALIYFAGTFPFWFKRREPLIFVPLGFALVCGYLLYVCLKTGGRWFLSFAFPVTMLTGAITTGGIALFRFGKRRRLLKIGILLVIIGCSAMLVEFFQVITFGGKMFTWSLYLVCGFSLIGLSLILCGLIPPWREYLERRLFL